jgi:predicted dehydrogenase
MRIGFKGELLDEPQIRVAVIGCGSHAFRNIFPTLQFAPIQLVATCDRAAGNAKAFADQFGAARAYTDHQQMLRDGGFDAVLIIVGCDAQGRPLYPDLVVECLDAGYHVWCEKPAAATCDQIERMQQAAARAGRNVMVGMKKMFFPANEKAKQIIDTPAFGTPHLAVLQYPQYVPSAEEFERFFHRRERVVSVIGFVDHLVHPTSLLVYLLGMPQTMYYERSAGGGGLATFAYASGAIATLALTEGASARGGMERTLVVGQRGNHVVVDNNIRVTWSKGALPRYGESPDYFVGEPSDTTSTWEPEFSLGQLYNKGLFLLGYFGELNEFARAILEHREPGKCHLRHAWQVTRLLECFSQGAGKTITV